MDFMKSQATFFQILESIFVIIAGSIALLTYFSQVRQNKISNAYFLIEHFHKNISSDDIRLLNDVYMNTYEATGVDLGFFRYWRAEKPCQASIAGLFTPEGRGLLLQSANLHLEGENVLQGDRDIDLSAVRRIANQLETLSYEALYGQVEHRVISYELGRTLEIVCFLLKNSFNEKEDWYELKQRYKHLLRLGKRIESRNLPRLSNIEFD
jgi:hypothetical protein